MLLKEEMNLLSEEKKKEMNLSAQTKRSLTVMMLE